MALEAGSCTVSPTDGSISGTGLAVVLAENDRAYMASVLPNYRWWKDARARANLESHTNGLAVAIIEYLLANAEITVTVKTTDAGLQRDPASSDPTLAPSADKEIQGALT